MNPVPSRTVNLSERLRLWIREHRGVRVVALSADPVTADGDANPPAFERFVNVERRPEGAPYACPCCGFFTLPARGQYELCPVCFWEDDGQDDHDADEVRGGPNGGLSLTEARSNYRSFGASSSAYHDRVRSPTPTELPP